MKDSLLEQLKKTLQLVKKKYLVWKRTIKPKKEVKRN